MKCTRCHKETDFFYTAGDVVLCENCACNSVAVMSDEGLFPFTDNVAAYQSWDEPAASEDSAEEPVPAGLLGEIAEVVNETMKKQKYMDPDKNLPEAEDDGLPEEKFPEQFPEE